MILRKKTTFIQTISHKLEKRRADLFQVYPNVMHLSMFGGGGGGRTGMGWGVDILIKEDIQIPHPWDKIIDQNPHPAASEAGQMSFVRSKSLHWGQTSWSNSNQNFRPLSDQTIQNTHSVPSHSPRGFAAL